MTCALQRHLSGLQSRVKDLDKLLDEELRVARNLGILTPFQRSTREAIEMALYPTSANVRQIRTDLCRLGCWVEILQGEVNLLTQHSFSQGKTPNNVPVNPGGNNGSAPYSSMHGSGHQSSQFVLPRERTESEARADAGWGVTRPTSGSVTSGTWTQELSASLSALSQPLARKTATKAIPSKRSSGHHHLNNNNDIHNVQVVSTTTTVITPASIQDDQTASRLVPKE